MPLKINIKLYKNKYCVLWEKDNFEVLDESPFRLPYTQDMSGHICHKEDLNNFLFKLRSTYNCDIRYKYSDEDKSVKYRPLELYQSFDKFLNLIEIDNPISWYFTKDDPVLY